MAWSSTRSAAGSVARERAHSDDAKHRQHDASRVPSSRPRWLLPALVGTVLVIGTGGAGAVVVAQQDDDESNPTGRGSETTSGDHAGAPGLSGRSFTLSGSATLVSQPFHGNPGRTQQVPFLYRGSCDDTGCDLTSKTGTVGRLRKQAEGSYTGSFRRTLSAPHGQLSWTSIYRLTVRSSSATVVRTDTGSFVGTEDGNDAHPPQTLTLSGPIDVTD